MKWPLVSRRALDMLEAENVRLVAQNAELLDHVKRMDRVSHGKAETVRQPRPEIEKMPKALQDHINGYGGAKYRQFMRGEAYRARAQGRPWAEIMAQHIPETEVEDAEVPQEARRD